MIAGRDGGRHENGEAFGLALEGGDPTLSTEAHAGTDQGTVELMNEALVIICMFYPSNLYNI